MIKLCSKCKIKKEMASFHNDKSSKDGKTGQCKTCRNASSISWSKSHLENVQINRKVSRNNNLERRVQESKEYYEKNSERLKEKAKSYREVHKEEISQRAKIKRDSNLDICRSKMRKYYRENKHIWTNHQKANKALYSERTSRYRAAKMRRTPNWLTEQDWKEIKSFYTHAALLTKHTGIKYVVDHIVPLQGKNVSGLHCPSNLQILTNIENCSKNNKWEV